MTLQFASQIMGATTIPSSTLQTVWAGPFLLLDAWSRQIFVSHQKMKNVFYAVSCHANLSLFTLTGKWALEQNRLNSLICRNFHVVKNPLKRGFEKTAFKVEIVFMSYFRSLFLLTVYSPANRPVEYYLNISLNRVLLLETSWISINQRLNLFVSTWKNKNAICACDCHTNRYYSSRIRQYVKKQK